MRQGIQTGFPHKELREWGCFFFSLCAWANLAFGKEFSDDYIIEKWEEYKTKKFIDWRGNTRHWIENCCLMHPALIFNDLADKPGYFKDNLITTKIPETKRFPVFFERQSPNGYDHFALGQVVNGKAEIIFDSWNPAAEKRGLKITNYRAFF